MIHPKGLESKKIRIQRIHMEEDAGKNIHMSGFSLVNLNRAGVPLIEVVSHPDMSRPEEASAYLKALYAVVTYLDICDGNLQEGNFRCDVNVSVRPKGQTKLGTRAEVKNVNSFRFVEKAIEYEAARQIEVIQSGGEVIQETRLFDSAKGVTISMRSKEEAHDYRYFPEPDLLPLIVTENTIEGIRSKLPELPEAKRQRYIKDYQLSEYDAGVLTATRELAFFFEETLELMGSEKKGDPKTYKQVSNYLTGEVSRLMNEAQKEINQSRLQPQHLADLIRLVLDAEISSTNAKVVIAEAWESGKSVDQIVKSKGLKQVSDTASLEPIVDAVISKHPDQVAQYQGGKTKLLGFFVGQCMKASKGQGNPQLFQEMIKKRLG